MAMSLNAKDKSSTLRPLTDDKGEVRELTKDDFRNMRPLREVDPDMIEAVEQWRRELAGRKSHITGI